MIVVFALGLFTTYLLNTQLANKRQTTKSRAEETRTDADLFVINRQGASSKTEIHALSGSSNFNDFSIHAATGLDSTIGNNWSFAIGYFYDDDYLPDVFAINKNGASGKTEIHVLSGKSNYSDFALHAVTGLGPTTGDNWVFDVGIGPDSDPRVDLFAINKQGASGKTEVHILQGGTGKDYSDFSLHAITPLGPTDKNWDFITGVFANDPKASDIYAINRRGASGKTEVHILSASSNYSDFSLHAVTPLEPTDNSNWSFSTGYFDKDLKADLYAINRNGASGKTEVSVLSAASNFSDVIFHAVTPLEATDNTNWTFAPSEDFPASSSAVPTQPIAPTATTAPVNGPVATQAPNNPVVTQSPIVNITQPIPTFVCAGSSDGICATPTVGQPNPTIGVDPTASSSPIISQAPIALSGTPVASLSGTPNPANPDPCSNSNNGFLQNLLQLIKDFIAKLFQSLGIGSASTIPCSQGSNTPAIPDQSNIQQPNSGLPANMPNTSGGFQNISNPGAGTGAAGGGNTGGSTGGSTGGGASGGGSGGGSTSGGGSSAGSSNSGSSSSSSSSGGGSSSSSTSSGGGSSSSSSSN